MYFKEELDKSCSWSIDNTCAETFLIGQAVDNFLLRIALLSMWVKPMRISIFKTTISLQHASIVLMKLFPFSAFY